MKSINKVSLMGYVGEEPKITSLKDGTKCANFSIATSESWVDKKTNERKSFSEWHRIVVFNQPIVGIVEKFVKKGSPLYVEGELKTRKYTNKDGNEVSTTEVMLKSYKGELILIGSKDTDEEPTTRSSKTQSFDDLNDDVPF
jgi:single-strand DNA-binding protein